MIKTGGYVMNAFTFILVTAVATVVFSFLLEAFNKSILMIFQPVQRFTAKLKRKSFMYYVSSGVVILVVFLIVELFSLNDIGFALILGFAVATNNLFFEKGFHEKGIRKDKGGKS